MVETCEQCRLPMQDGLCKNAMCRIGADNLRRAANVAANVPAALHPAQAAATSDAYDDAQLERLKELFAKREREKNGAEFITICGFPTAGKSWLIPRLAKVLGEQRSWTVVFDPKTPELGDEDVVAGVQQLGQTRDLLIHSLGSKLEQPARRVTLIDIPGEYLRRMIDSPDGSDVPPAMLAALAIADRILFTLPSDVCVIGSLLQGDIGRERTTEEKRQRAQKILGRNQLRLLDRRAGLEAKLARARKRKQVDNEAHRRNEYRFAAISEGLSEHLIMSQWAKLGKFSVNIERVLGWASYLAHRVGKAKFLAMSPSDWRKGYDPDEAQHYPPLCFNSMAVLTKADRVLPLLSDRQWACNGAKLQPGVDWDQLPERAANRQALADSGWNEGLGKHLGDPRLVLAMTSPDLVGQLDGWLPNLRYEWASAAWQANGWSATFDSAHQHAGIERLADWMAEGTPEIVSQPDVVRRVAKLRAMLEGRKHVEGRLP